MPKNLPTKCKSCSRRKSARLHISRRGLCTDCATARIDAAIRGAVAAVDEVAANIAANGRPPRKRASARGVGGTRRTTPPAA